MSNEIPEEWYNQGQEEPDLPVAAVEAKIQVFIETGPKEEDVMEAVL